MGPDDEATQYRLRAAAYRKVIERYADEITAGEQKTIPELKALVTPLDPAVLGLKRQFLEKIGAAEATPDNFLQYAEEAFSYVKSLSSIHSELAVSFWMRPSDIVELGAADAFDRCMLLCSLLVAGGGSAKVRVLELEGGDRHPVVLAFSNGRHYLMDSTQDQGALAFSGSLEQVFSRYSFEGKRVTRSAFEFNNDEYTDFE